MRILFFPPAVIGRRWIRQSVKKDLPKHPQQQPFIRRNYHHSSPAPLLVQSLSLFYHHYDHQKPSSWEENGQSPCCNIMHARNHTFARRTIRCFSTSKNDHDDDNSSTTTSQEPSSSSSPPVTTSDPGTSFQIPGSIHGGRKLAIVFTCNVCETRSAKQFTENAYLHGVVLVRCPGCRNLHLIADRLGWFDDTDGKDFDLERLQEMTGQKIKRVGDDTVWELTLEDLIGTEKMQQILEQQQQQQRKHEQLKDENPSTTKDS